MSHPTYWIMSCEQPLSAHGEAMLELMNDMVIPGVRSWKLGRPFTVDIETPILVDMLTYRGYRGPPVELWDSGVPLLSARLAEALIRAGVSTLDLYDAVIREPTSEKQYRHFAYNVTLLLAAADMERSEWYCYDNNLMFDVSFFDLVIDPSKCHDELLFRLAQNINALMVHDSVREEVLASGIDTLSFIRPEDWMQI